MSTAGRPADPGDEALPDTTFRNFALIGSAVAASIGLIWLLNGEILFAMLLFALGAVELLAYHGRRRLGTAAALHIGVALPTLWILTIVAVTGGPTGPRGVWLLLPPIVAALLFPARVAFRWGIVYVAAAVALWSAAFAGVAFPNIAGEHELEHARAVSGLIAFLATVALTFVYSFAQQRSLNLVRTTNVHLSSVLEALPEAVLAVERVTTPAGAAGGRPPAAHTVLFMNSAMVELLGGRYGGRALEDFMPATRRAGEFVRQLLLQLDAVAESGHALDWRLELPGAERPDILEVHSRPIAAPEGEQIVTIVLDMTDRIATDHRLMQAARLASIGELVAGVAHELNNPLTAIRSTAELVASETEGVLADDLQRIRDNADRAARIVRSLLSFARETPPERQPTQINDVVRHALRLRSSKDSGIRFVLDLDPRLPETWADGNQLEQVLLNLVSNAEHALQESQPPDREIGIRTSRLGGMLTLEVRDNGPGIPAELLSRIFDPFFTTRPLGDGTGLGLAVSHGIVAKHGGSIHVRSVPGAGTTFTVELPVVVPPAEPPPSAPAAGAEPLADAAARRRVLVVDDEPSIRSVLARFLRRRGHHVDEAGSGEEADRLADAGGYDAIVLDIKMPGTHGDALFRRWRAERPALAARVIFATGDTVTGATSGFLHATGQPVFEKPYDLVDLALAVERTQVRVGSADGQTADDDAD